MLGKETIEVCFFTIAILYGENIPYRGFRQGPADLIWRDPFFKSQEDLEVWSVSVIKIKDTDCGQKPL